MSLSSPTPSVRSTPAAVTPARGTPRRARTVQELYGRAPEELLDELFARAGGCLLDAAGCLRVSTMQAGVPPEIARRNVDAAVEHMRARMRERVAALRAFALANAFPPPPPCANEAKKLDRQLKVCTKTLAEARARIRSLEYATRNMAKRAETLSDARSALKPAGVDDIEMQANNVVDDARQAIAAVDALSIGNVETTPETHSIEKVVNEYMDHSVDVDGVAVDADMLDRDGEDDVADWMIADM